MAAKRYRVTGALVSVVTSTTNGPMAVHLYEGSPVPADASQAWIDHHLSTGQVEEIPQAEAPPPEVKAPPGPRPARAAEQPSGKG